MNSFSTQTLSKKMNAIQSSVRTDEGMIIPVLSSNYLYESASVTPANVYYMTAVKYIKSNSKWTDCFCCAHSKAGCCCLL